MHRRSVHKGRSARKFKKNVRKVAKLNVQRPGRGGFRL